MKTEKILLAALIFCIVARAAVSYPINDYYPAGTDTSVHVLRTWLFKNFGLIRWNYYSEGGMPLMSIYPPLAYIFTGFLGKFLDVITAYKLVNNLFFIATPVIFFFFLEELGLDERKTIIALLFFTLMPMYPFYFADGRYPSLASFTFSIAAWLFLIKNLKSKKPVYAFLSALSFSASLLTNPTIGIMSLPIIFLWMVLHELDAKSAKWDSMKKIIAVYLMAFLFSAWWTVPYALDRISFGGSSSLRLLVMGPAVRSFTDDILIRIGLLGNYVSSVAVTATYALLGITSVLCLVSLTEIKNRTNRQFVLLAIAIVAISAVSTFKRTLIFLPIPLGIVAAYGLEKLKASFKILAAILLLSSLMLSFFMVRPREIRNPVFPQLPKDGRFIFFGNETKYYGQEVVYDLYYTLSAVQGNENIQGWYSWGQTSFSTSSLYSLNTIKYGWEILNLTEGNEKNYYKVMKAGWVNYFVFDTGDVAKMSFFNSSMYRTYSVDERFTVLEMVPKAKYVEVNGEGVEASFEKGIDMITINMACNTGAITVKERFDKHWVAFVNGKEVALSENEYGFTKFDNTQTGPCAITIKYESKIYEKTLFAVSLASLAVAAAYCFYGTKNIRR